MDTCASNDLCDARSECGLSADIWSMDVVIAELRLGEDCSVSFENEEEREHWKDVYSEGEGA